MDHVFVERLWRTLTYEEVFITVYATAIEARTSVGAHTNGPH